MRVLIVSDTHGDDSAMWEAIDAEAPIDMLIHCGDIEHEPTELLEELDCPIHVVGGNNDFMLNLPETDTFNIGKYKVLLTHGHHYRIYREQSCLFYLAEDNNADIVMFGHLHEPILQQDGNITILNPGSLTYPRQEGHRPSYIIMEVDENENVSYEVRYL